MSMFERRHYQAIAEVIRNSPVFGSYLDTRQLCVDQVEQVACELADLFEADNPRFDRERFLEACTSVSLHEVTA